MGGWDGKGKLERVIWRERKGEQEGKERGKKGRSREMKVI